MNSLDSSQFAAALNSLAEVLDHKPLTAKAVELWFDTLREFDATIVLNSLRNWAKSHSKFPAPSEVWNTLNSAGIHHREELAAAEKKAFAKPLESMATPYGREKLKEIYAILAKPKKSPAEHWQSVLNDPNSPAIALRFAHEFFKHPVKGRREPGSDFEEDAFSDIEM